jgi:hypothetical protein
MLSHLNIGISPPGVRHVEDRFEVIDFESVRAVLALRVRYLPQFPEKGPSEGPFENSPLLPYADSIIRPGRIFPTLRIIGVAVPVTLNDCVNAVLGVPDSTPYTVFAVSAVM